MATMQELELELELPLPRASPARGEGVPAFLRLLSFLISPSPDVAINNAGYMIDYGVLPNGQQNNFALIPNK